ncbi:hypothetical protein QT397_09215 [Microbulbifer sp. MKSA007]|nr:hypothetical protein QT397_09215 [Microbulbifer sp. MKSA007]
MKEIEFTHKFIINSNGIPFSNRASKGKLAIDIDKGGVCLSGDKDGLLALAAKIIEVANCEIPSYHKHLDELEIPNITVLPMDKELVIGKINE